MSTLRGLKIQHKQAAPNKEFNCVMVTNLRQRNTLQFQYFLNLNKRLRAIFSQLIFGNFWLWLSVEVAEARLKSMWFAITRVWFFEYTWPVGKKKIYNFEMEKTSLILIYNIFVTKKIFFRNKQKILTCMILVDSVGWRQTNIFYKSNLTQKLLKMTQKCFKSPCSGESVN